MIGAPPTGSTKLRIPSRSNALSLSGSGTKHSRPPGASTATRAMNSALKFSLDETIAAAQREAALGVAAYVAPLVAITAGYALVQAANNTAVMAGVAPDAVALGTRVTFAVAGVLMLAAVVIAARQPSRPHRA